MLETINKYLTDFWNVVDIEFIFKFFVFYIAIIWIVMIIRVMRDIITRTNNLFYQIICVILIFITAPIGGILFYILIRPSRTLNEHFYAEIEGNIDILEEIINERKNIKTDKKDEILLKSPKQKEELIKETEKIEKKEVKKTPIRKQKSKIELKKF